MDTGAGESRASGAHAITEAVYDIFRSRPRHGWTVAGADLPRNGIYAFFERGESVLCRNAKVDRIVRIGTHTRPDNFRNRIRQHYGPIQYPSGNRGGSIFRKHIGRAMLRLAGEDQSRLRDWDNERLKHPDIEARVSQYLRDNFTFSCVRVDEPHERARLEQGLIALLAQYPLGRPSSGWLGHHATSEVIRNTGLWNVKDVDAQALKESELQRLQQLTTVPIV